MPEAEKRIGRQFPTQSVVLPYTQTKGGEAILLYDQSSRKTMEWQQSMLYDIMATDDDGLWVHIKFGYSIPRRNGKSEIAVARAIWGLLLLSTYHSFKVDKYIFQCYNRVRRK